MMDCRKYLEMMQKELDGELSELEVKILKKHIDQCPSCAEEYRSFQLIAGLFDDLKMEEPPLDLKVSVMAEISQMEVTTAPLDAKEEVTLVTSLKKGIGFLILFALLNAIYFGYWVISSTGFGFNHYQLLAFYQIMTQSFSRFMVIGQHTGNAVQLVFKSFAQLVPLSWFYISLLMMGILIFSLWTLIRRKRGDLS